MSADYLSFDLQTLGKKVKQQKSFYFKLSLLWLKPAETPTYSYSYSIATTHIHMHTKRHMHSQMLSWT